MPLLAEQYQAMVLCWPSYLAGLATVPLLAGLAFLVFAIWMAIGIRRSRPATHSDQSGGPYDDYPTY